MSTITSRELLTNLLRNAGVYEGDPPVKRVYRYKSFDTGNVQYAVFYEPEHDDLRGRDTAFCREVSLLMHDGVLTPDGINELLGEDTFLPNEDGTMSFDEGSLRQRGKHFVNVYMHDRRFGGHEEGGWWFDTYDAIQSEPAQDEEHAEEIKREYEEGHFSNEGRPPVSSVSSRGRYQVRIEDHPAYSMRT